jgi:hypothetical protein
MQKNVRQEWHQWNIDAVYPMLYHSCYGKDLSWIEEETRKCRTLLPSTELNSGIYIPAIKPHKLKRVIEYANNGGADGVSFFDFNAMKNGHWEVLNFTSSCCPSMAGRSETKTAPKSSAEEGT